MKLSTGALLMYRDRNEAEKNLKDAEKEFLGRRTGRGSSIRCCSSEPGDGSAQVYESLCEVDKAREYYTKVASAEPSWCGQLAQRRHDQIAGRETERWFAWFEKQVPKPPAGDAGRRQGAVYAS